MLLKEDIQKRLIQEVYSGPILNNSHRGDIIEIIVLEALGVDWKLVGLGWHPWNTESTQISSKIRIQVKQCAALQLWGPTQKVTLSFPWTQSLSQYYVDRIPGIETEGYTRMRINNKEAAICL